MKTSLEKDTRGIAHVGLVAVAVLVVSVIAFSAWRVFTSNSSKLKTEDNSKAVCDTEDQNLCKFFHSFNSVDGYKADISRKSSKGAKTSINYEKSGKNTRVKISGIKSGDKKVNFEYMVFGKTIYLKSTNNTWWKQALSIEREKQYMGEFNYNFQEQQKGSDAANAIKYTLTGQEPCGHLNCFIYEVEDPLSPDDKKTIWIDDKSYLLRKMNYKNSDYSSATEFKYVIVNLVEPKDVKILGPNQFILPGKTKPEALPAGSTPLQL